MSVTKTNWVEVTQKIGIPQPPDSEDLIYEDGIPMESDWHRAAMNLLIEILLYFWRHRSDVYVSGNIFVYFDPNQLKTRNFRGPDFFVVKGVKDSQRWREAWIVWQEDGLAPNFVIELTSAGPIAGCASLTPMGIWFWPSGNPKPRLIKLPKLKLLV